MALYQHGDKTGGAVCPGSLATFATVGGAVCSGSLSTSGKTGGAVCPGSLATLATVGGAVCHGSLSTWGLDRWCSVSCFSINISNGWWCSVSWLFINMGIRQVVQCVLVF